MSVIKTKSKLFCIDSTCFHTGGPLALGDIEEVQGEDCISCPWHSYKISLSNGAKFYQSMDMNHQNKLVPAGWKKKEKCQRVHKVEIKNQEIFVEINTDGVYDSDNYGKSSICGNKLSNVSYNLINQNGTNGFVQQTIGGSKSNYGNLHSSLNKPLRSGHVLNPNFNTLESDSSLCEIVSNRLDGDAGYRLLIRMLNATAFESFEKLFEKQLFSTTHVKIGVLVNGTLVERFFTPLSVRDSKIEFAIRSYPDGVFSTYLANVSPTSTLRVLPEPPTIAFSADDDVPGPVILFAGGSGITPMIQLIRKWHKLGLPLKVKLVVSNSQYDRALCLDILREIALFENVEIVFLFVKPPPTTAMTILSFGTVVDGQVNQFDFLKSLVPDPETTTCLLCGPLPFVLVLENYLPKLGINKFFSYQG